MSSPDEELNQQIQRKFIRENVKPFQNTRKINITDDSIPVYKVEKIREPIEEEQQLPYTPIMDEKKNNYHNCMEIYYSIQNCPICRKIYSKNDSIYISIIIILVITIIILLKMVFQK